MCGGCPNGVIQGSIISNALLSLDETVDVGFLWRVNRFSCLSRIPTQPYSTRDYSGGGGDTSACNPMRGSAKEVVLGEVIMSQEKWEQEKWRLSGEINSRGWMGSSESGEGNFMLRQV